MYVGASCRAPGDRTGGRSGAPPRTISPLVRGSRSHFHITMVVREKKTRSLRLCCLSGFPDAGAPTTNDQAKTARQCAPRRGAGGSSALGRRRWDAGHQEPTSETAHVHSMCTVTAQSGTLLAPFAFRSVAPAVLGGAEQEHGESSPRPPRDDPDPRKPRRPLVASYRPLLTLAMTSAPGRQV